jgi:hypothetical protein
MESIPGTTHEGIPFLRIEFISPYVGHVGPPYITTLTLSGLTIGLSVWFFSTPVNINDSSASFVSIPPHDHQPHVNPLPSSPVGSSSHSSSSPSEISTASNQVDKKNKKRMIKKKKNNLGGKLPTSAGHVGSDQPTTVHHAGSVDIVDKSTKTHRKPKFPCSICKGEHLLKDFPGIPKVVEVWSEVPQPVSSTTASHVGDKPSTSDNIVRSKKGKVNFPFLLCKDMHRSYLFPRMDEASYLLENIVDSQQELPSPNLPLVHELVNPVPSPVNLVD